MTPPPRYTAQLAHQPRKRASSLVMSRIFAYSSHSSTSHGLHGPIESPSSARSDIALPSIFVIQRLLINSLYEARNIRAAFPLCARPACPMCPDRTPPRITPLRCLRSLSPTASNGALTFLSRIFCPKNLQPTVPSHQLSLAPDRPSTRLTNGSYPSPTSIASLHSSTPTAGNSANSRNRHPNSYHHPRQE